MRRGGQRVTRAFAGFALLALLATGCSEDGGATRFQIELTHLHLGEVPSRFAGMDDAAGAPYIGTAALMLVRLSDLEPFRKLQRLAMLRSGGLLSYADLARDASLTSSTVRRYLEYLRLSYQVFLVQPFARNLTSSVIKTPKLYWMDLGLLRQETLSFGPLDGRLFETLVVGEIRKWIDTAGRDVELTFYRTRTGLEVDLFLRTAQGILGVEIKNREAVQPPDWRPLRAVADALGDEWLGGLVVYRGRRLHVLDADRAIHAMPVHRLL